MSELDFQNFVSNLKRFIDQVDMSSECLNNHLDLTMPIHKLEIYMSKFHNKHINCQRNTISSHKWNESHDEFLLKTVYRYSNNWKKIQNRLTKVFTKRFEVSFLRNKYLQLKSRQEDIRRRFDSEEDLRLMELVQTYGKNWIAISDHFFDRNPSMIKNRYYYLSKQK